MGYPGGGVVGKVAQVQDVYLHELTASAGALRFSTGEVADVRAEPLAQLPHLLRQGDASYVPRDSRYVEALTLALSRLYPEEYVE